MKLDLTGEANDYVGKGMAGGEVVIRPPPGSRFAAEDASLVGNTCLYGATGGRLFVNGRAGARPPRPGMTAAAAMMAHSAICIEPCEKGVLRGTLRRLHGMLAPQ